MQTVYFNEFDPYASSWLRSGFSRSRSYVDDRSVVDIRPEDLAGYYHVHLFAGIGGWAYALALAGWPEDREVWTGSCPCQPFSQVGKGLGEKDPRHLWPEFRRLVAERRPPTIFGEQVASEAGRAWLAGVRTDLEGLGYAVGAADLCAASLGAPHIRQRLYWVAESTGARLQGGAGGGIDGAGRPSVGLVENSGSLWLADPGRERQWERGGDALADRGATGGMAEPEHAERRTIDVHRQDGRDGPHVGRTQAHGVAGARGQIRAWDAYDLLPCRDGKARRVEPGSFPLAHGVPARVGRLRAYGNAIVPQVAAEFVEAYLNVERERHCA